MPFTGRIKSVGPGAKNKLVIIQQGSDVPLAIGPFACLDEGAQALRFQIPAGNLGNNGFKTPSYFRISESPTLTSWCVRIGTVSFASKEMNLPRMGEGILSSTLYRAEPAGRSAGMMLHIVPKGLMSWFGALSVERH